MRHHLTRPRHTTQEKILVILFLALFEVFAGVYFWDHSKPQTLSGYLIKNGNTYMVFWTNTWNENNFNSYSSLGDALSFAQSELGLKAASSTVTYPLEHMWLRSDIGKTVLYWKTLDTPILNRLSFKRESDAVQFEKIFKQGGYSPSPYGHAISLIRITKG